MTGSFHYSESKAVLASSFTFAAVVQCSHDSAQASYGLWLQISFLLRRSSYSISCSSSDFQSSRAFSAATVEPENFKAESHLFASGLAHAPSTSGILLPLTYAFLILLIMSYEVAPWSEARFSDQIQKQQLSIDFFVLCLPLVLLKSLLQIFYFHAGFSQSLYVALFLLLSPLSVSGVLLWLGTAALFPVAQVTVALTALADF